MFMGIPPAILGKRDDLTTIARAQGLHAGAEKDGKENAL
jgi:hypothetical protein